MHYFSPYSIEMSDWRVASDRRLRISMLIATAFVAGLLSSVRMPEIRFMNPLVELVVDITRFRAAPVLDAPAPADMQVPTPANEVVAEQSSPPAESAADVREQAEETATAAATQPVITEPLVNWEAAKSEAVQNAVDHMEESFSVNPGFDERRAAAANRFRASAAPVKKPIWENVETDQLGRTLLRNGDCFRVLNDPSAANRWAFENFDQYITYCTYRKYVGKDLEWVKDIHRRFAYLRNRSDRRNEIVVED